MASSFAYKVRTKEGRLHLALEDAALFGADLIGERRCHLLSLSDQPVELFDLVAALESDLVAHLAALDDLGEVLVHDLHPELPARLHRRIDLVRLSFADEVSHRGSGDQDLGGHGAALAGREWHELL